MSDEFDYGDDIDDDALAKLAEAAEGKLTSNASTESYSTQHCAKRIRLDGSHGGNGNNDDYPLSSWPSDVFESSPLHAGISEKPHLTANNNNPSNNLSRLVAPLHGLRQTTLHGATLDQLTGAERAHKAYAWSKPQPEEPTTHHELDREAMSTWVYPTNLGRIRDYQFSIVSVGLYHNLLVALPTGLGKTFIAATIMLNWYRWTKSAQIIFVAPTKPLVSQQVDACFNIAGIPRSQTTMLTGDVPPSVRTEEWEVKRVFFMTPQTLINDLKTGLCNPKRIVLLVVDEAHRATGAYAYVEVVRFISRFNQSFRVLALTATPGSDVESVQQVIQSLRISRTQIRTENSLDIREYVHHRHVEKRVFEYSDDMNHIMKIYAQTLTPLVSILKNQNAYWITDPMLFTPFGLTKARQQWMGSPAGHRAAPALRAMINSIFSLLASFAHGLELLKYHGIRPFYMKMASFREETEKARDRAGKYRRQINESEHFNRMMKTLGHWTRDNDFVGHPKLEYLKNCLMEHFLDMPSDNGRTTRVIVFANFRDSAEDIVRVLKPLAPTIRPHIFVGQASSKNSDGMQQKAQIQALSTFRSGEYNTLVATSIGEEGLDIGEVDLIICYDSKASPLRMLQRMGRTGRKRAGKIILLQMRGKEEEDAEKARIGYERIQEEIARGDKFIYSDDLSFRILPASVTPKLDARTVEIPIENSQLSPQTFLPLPSLRKRTKAAPGKRPPKKFHMPDGVETGFIKVSALGSVKSAHNTSIDECQPALDIPSLETLRLSECQKNDLINSYAGSGDTRRATLDLILTNKWLNDLLSPSKIFDKDNLVHHSTFSNPSYSLNDLIDSMHQFHQNVRRLSHGCLETYANITWPVKDILLDHHEQFVTSPRTRSNTPNTSDYPKKSINRKSRTTSTVSRRQASLASCSLGTQDTPDTSESENSLANFVVPDDVIDPSSNDDELPPLDDILLR